MEGDNWRGGGQVPMVQPQAGTVEQIALSSSGGAPLMDPDDWRAQLPLDSRQRIVDKVMETLKKHLPFTGQEGLEELKKIAVRFEEKIYSAATSQSDYLRKISLKMLTMETTKSQSPMAANSLQPGAANASRNPSDLGSLDIVPPPSTPVAPSPVHAESEKVNASLSSHLDTDTGHIQAPNAAGSSALPVAISITNTNDGHLEAPNAAGSSVLPLSVSIGESEIVNARLSSQPNTHILHLQAPNPAGSSAKPLAISITITIA